MATTDKIISISKFYGGITRDDKSKMPGVASNIEELDIFTNGDYIQAEQIFSADAFPSSSEGYSYTSSQIGNAYAYGRETGASKVRIFELVDASVDNPGSWTTFFTSASTTDLAYAVSPIQFFTTSEAAQYYLYYITKDSVTIKLKRIDTSTQTEATVGTLTGLTGSYDRISIKVIFGEMFITNGKYIAKVDGDGVFTEKAFTLPNEWKAVDLCPVSDVCLILAKYIDRSVNYSKGFWWDLTSSTQFDDSFDLPMGGPQWIQNHKETIKICCATNGQARFFQLSGAYAGAVPVELPGMVLNNVQVDSSLQPVSPPKTVAVKDKILYFGLWKTDKTGIYALGQLDNDKPTALILSKRFATSDYSLHKPTGLLITGPNFFGSYSDNGTTTTVHCESNNSPSRSSSGVYESIWIDDSAPLSNKDMTHVFVSTQPLPASTDVNIYVASDYGNYGEIFRPDATSMNTTSAVVAMFKSTAVAKKKVFKVKAQLVSSGTSSPKLTSLGMRVVTQSTPAPN